MAATPVGIWKIGTLALVKDGKVVPTAEYGHNFDRAIEILHSPHAERIGAVLGPLEITFSIRMYDIRKSRNAGDQESSSRIFLQGMINKEPFDCHISYKDANSGIWSYNKISFKDCFVTSQRTAGFNANGVPMVDLQCVALDVEIEPFA